MDSTLAVIFEKSFTAGIAVYLLIRMWQVQKESTRREERLAVTLSASEKFIRERLSQISSTSSDAIKANYRVLQGQTQSMNDLTRVLGGLPCSTPDSFYPHPASHAEYSSVPRPAHREDDSTGKAEERWRKMNIGLDRKEDSL